MKVSVPRLFRPGTTRGSKLSDPSRKCVKSQSKCLIIGESLRCCRMRGAKNLFPHPQKKPSAFSAATVIVERAEILEPDGPGQSCHIYLHFSCQFPHLFIGDIDTLSELFEDLNEKCTEPQPSAWHLVGSWEMLTLFSKYGAWISSDALSNTWSYIWVIRALILHISKDEVGEEGGAGQVRGKWKRNNDASLLFICNNIPVTSLRI